MRTNPLEIRERLGPAYGELNLTGIGRLPYKLFLFKEELRGAATFRTASISH